MANSKKNRKHLVNEVTLKLDGFRCEYTQKGTLVKRNILKFKSSSDLRNGIQVVHIGQDIWRIGRTNFVINKATGKEERHVVIYGPDNKEYNVFGKDVNTFDSYATSSKNRPHYNLGMVKVFILTQILDNVSNWCFDLKKIPSNNILKVVYDNGTIKNIEFVGEFNPFVSEKDKKRYNKNWESIEYIRKYPIAYRKHD
jgi:uncharacterized 2Fe-2S/4Fe-4S cluster protein (DUF4445 family)